MNNVRTLVEIILRPIKWIRSYIFPTIEPDPELGIYKITYTATIPNRAHDIDEYSDVGLDLYADENVKIPKWSRATISTGIGFQIPVGHYIRIAARSGLSCTKNIDIGAGVIDRGYRGICKVCLINSNDIEYEVKRGDKIAQAILEKVSYPKIMVISECLSESTRGCNGFGSSG